MALLTAMPEPRDSAPGRDRAPARSRLAAVAAIATVAALSVTAPANASTTARLAALVTNPGSLVNTFIGTTNGADDFPGADVPFGGVQWSPDTTSRPFGGGYSYNDSAITGFSLTHLSGPGCAGEGDVPILPTVGAVNTSATDGFSHSSESATPGYYQVTTSNGVETQLTATTRSGMAQFTFPATTQANLIFKLNGSANGDSNTQFNVVSNTEVSGQLTSGKFCGSSAAYTLYFDMVFNQSFASNGTAAAPLTATSPVRSGASPNAAEQPNHPVLHGTLPASKPSASPNAITPAVAASDGYVTFNTTSNPVVLAKIGISYVSTANAVANRTTENPNWNFSATQSAAEGAWNTLLGKVQVTGGTAAQQTVFYTALYHSLLHPNVISDVNGQYPGFNGTTVETVDSGHSAVYGNYSGWDVYRSQAQLEALIDPQVASDTAESMLDDYEQTGLFPKWNQNNAETYVMVGDPADSIIADYYAFGATNFNTSATLTDLLSEANNTNNDRPGLNYLEQLGYEPTNGSYGCCNFYGNTSTTLEYDAADYALSEFAGELGNTAAQTTLANRANDWLNEFDYSSGFIQPRDESGSWTSGFTPTSQTDFVEADSEIYTPMVPFNIQGLANAMGGDAKLVSFLNTDLTTFTGANGYTDLGNEPSLNIPWEYDYVGEPYQTQSVVRAVQDQIWTDAPGGLAGNDDLGEMSSWYVWSALGMYPETPGSATLALGSPMFTQAVITLPSGNTLTINGNGAADNAPYVQSATWNGAAWNNAYTPSGMLSAGGTLSFTLGTSANTSWAAAASAAPPSYGGTQGYSDIGVSNDSATSAANFDGGGYSYSATALANAGVNPGSTITANGLSFTWPGAAAGTPDNYEANGQTVPVTGSGSISFLGSASSGPSSGTATVTYTDGSTQSVPITFSDWTLGGGTASPSSGNTIAVTTAYRNHADAAADTSKTYVFATAPVTLTSGKTVASVRLPSNVNTGALHVFAIATGSGGTTPVEGPYGGTPAAVPGTVQAANYDTGGQGVAYNVTSVNGTANSYRSDGVDLEACTDTGSAGCGDDLGWAASGQWFRYTVTVATAGTYAVSLRLAAPSAVTDGLHIASSSGANLSGAINVPATGGWQDWTTVTANVTLPAGQQTLTIDQDNGGWNLRYLSFSSSSTTGINPSAWYEVVNTNSGLCASAAGGGTANGTAVQQLACTGATSQLWQFVPTSVSGEYEVLNDNAQSEGESWNITGGVPATASGDLLQTWNYGGTGNTNALFAATQQASGSYAFTADNSGLCIDTPGSSTTSGVQLQQYTCNNTSAQSFNLVVG
jgi:predicted alpha-1,2-mannosidase